MSLLTEAEEYPGDWVIFGACRAFYEKTGYDAWYGPDEDEIARVTAAIPDEVQAQMEVTAMKQNARKTAIQVCASCPVRAECLRYAMTTDIRHGVWGGLSPYSRQALKHKLERNAA